MSMWLLLVHIWTSPEGNRRMRATVARGAEQWVIATKISTSNLSRTQHSDRYTGVSDVLYSVSETRHSSRFCFNLVGWLVFALCSLKKGAQMVGSSTWGNQSQHRLLWRRNSHLSRTFQTLRMMPHNSSVSPHPQTVWPRVSHLPRHVVTPCEDSEAPHPESKGRTSFLWFLYSRLCPDLITLIFVTTLLSLVILHLSETLIKQLSEEYGPLSCGRRDVWLELYLEAL